MFRRIFAILLALCVLFSVMFTYAEEDEDFGDDELTDDSLEDEELDDSSEEEEKIDFRTIGGYDIPTETFGDFTVRWNEDGTGAILTGYGGTDKDLVLPDTINDLPVIAIDTSMCLCNPVIETLEIPGSVQTVGVNAFAQCQKLRSVVIREGVVTLDKCCFGGCVFLTEITLPESLVTVEDFVFAGCINLPEVTFGSGLQSIGRQVFFKCLALSRVTIPGGEAVAIGEQAFEECAEDFQIVY